MKRFLQVIFMLLLVTGGFADLKDFGFRPLRHKLDTKEDLFRLYTRWLYSDLDSTSRNILYLELAYTLPFDHPIKALTPITNQVQYQRYRHLLMMQISLLLVKAYINYGYLYMKEHLYFFNREFFKNYLDGYDVAEFYFGEARKYWKIAKDLARLADGIKGYRIAIPFWEDQLYRIKTGDLDYDEILDHLMSRLRKNRAIIKSALKKENK